MTSLDAKVDVKSSSMCIFVDLELGDDKIGVENVGDGGI